VTVVAPLTRPCEGSGETARPVRFLAAADATGRLAHLSGLAFGTCGVCGKTILTLSRPFVRVPAHRVPNVTQATR
jgi:hypothetical protein